MKPQREDHTERTEREAWATIPKRPQRNPEAATDFDTAHIYASDEAVDPDKAHGATRGEIEAALQGLGFTDNERRVVLAVRCDRLDTHAAVARATKLDPKTVRAIRQRATVREVLKRLRRDEPLPTPQDTPYKGTPTKGLHLCNCDHHARAMLEMTDTDNIGRPARYQWARRNGLPPEVAEMPGLLRYLKSDQLTAQAVVELVRAHPPLLLYPGCEALRENFVALLLAANYGASRHKGATPQGKRRTVAAQARKTLAALTRWPKATGYCYPGATLAEIVEFYRRRIVELQTAFGPGFTDERLTKFRREHGREFDRYSDRELREIVKGNPLTIAARCAGKVADMKPDSFLRAYRQHRPSD